MIFRAGIDTSSNESIPEKQQSGLGVASFTLSLVSISATVTRIYRETDWSGETETLENHLLMEVDLAPKTSRMVGLYCIFAGQIPLNPSECAARHTLN